MAWSFITGTLSVRSTPYDCPKGLRGCIDVFGDDLEQAKNHFRTHLRAFGQYIRETDGLAGKNLTLRYFCNPSIARGIHNWVTRELKFGSSLHPQGEKEEEEGEVPAIFLFIKKIE